MDMATTGVDQAYRLISLSGQNC